MLDANWYVPSFLYIFLYVVSHCIITLYSGISSFKKIPFLIHKCPFYLYAYVPFFSKIAIY